MPRIFLTGGTGFLGTRLLRRLQERGISVVALSRSTPLASAPQKQESPIWVRGDLVDPDSYVDALEGSDAVVHLAALTGKARRSAYFRTNADATRTLTQACCRLGVRRFLLVSSLVATFPHRRHYYYAQSKALAEEIVAASDLDYTIVRPTIIVGPGSGSFEGLCKLASLPVLPVFGSGRTRIQPISADDVVEVLLTILDRDLFHRQALDIAGPAVLSIEEFLRQIHQRLRGRPPRVLHIPLGPVIMALAALERVALPLLPVTAGQLSAFRHDGVASDSATPRLLGSQPTSVQSMLESSVKS